MKVPLGLATAVRKGMKPPESSTMGLDLIELYQPFRPDIVSSKTCHYH
jgi:hypothetical protein